MVRDAAGYLRGRGPEGLDQRMGFGYSTPPLPRLPRDSDWLLAARLAGLDTDLAPVRNSVVQARKLYADREALARQKKFQRFITDMESAADAAGQAWVTSTHDPTEFRLLAIAEIPRLVRGESEAIKGALSAAALSTPVASPLDNARLQRVVSYFARKATRGAMQVANAVLCPPYIVEDLEDISYFQQPGAWDPDAAAPSLVEYEREAPSYLFAVIDVAKDAIQATHAANTDAVQAAHRRAATVTQRLWDFEVRAAEGLSLRDASAAAEVRMIRRSRLAPPQAPFFIARARLDELRPPAGIGSDQAAQVRAAVAAAIVQMDAATRDRNVDLMTESMRPQEQTEANARYAARMRAARDGMQRSIRATLDLVGPAALQLDQELGRLDAAIKAALQPIGEQGADGLWTARSLGADWPGTWGALGK